MFQQRRIVARVAIGPRIGGKAKRGYATGHRQTKHRWVLWLGAPCVGRDWQQLIAHRIARVHRSLQQQKDVIRVVSRKHNTRLTQRGATVSTAIGPAVDGEPPAFAARHMMYLMYRLLFALLLLLLCHGCSLFRDRASRVN